MKLVLLSYLIFLSVILPTFADDVKGKCPIGEHWVSAHHRRAYYRADGTFYSASHVDGGCRKNSGSYENWVARLKDSRPADWPNQKEKSKPWTDEERERLFEALDSLPETMLPTPVSSVYRMDKSQNHPENGGSSFEETIILYDLAFTTKKNLARVLAHELAHIIYENMNPKDQTAYQFATNWFDFSPIGAKKPIWTNRRNETEFVEPDGVNGPEEDFANNIDYYLFNPGKLKKATPHAFAWIKNHFGDKFKLRKVNK